MQTAKTNQRSQGRWAQRLEMTSGMFVLALVVVGGIIALFEGILSGDHSGSILLTLTFWAALSHGCLALVAAAELSKATWIQSVKRELLAFYPLTILIALLFLLVGLKLNIYPWHEHTNRWLNPSFFLGRNFVLLLLVGGLGWAYARESIQEGARKSLLAALYIFAFVVAQSLIAFDWIMSLEYPWFSTLFGGYFFVESLYTGIALAGILCALLLGSSPKAENPNPVAKTLKDSATLMFGFALFWAGLFFAQYLVIWYGNIPEETSFLVQRVTASPLRELSALTLLFLFFIPFGILLPQRAKSNASLVRAIAFIVLAGVFLERLVFLLPVETLSLPPLVVIVEFLGFAFLAVLTFVNRERLIGNG